MLTAATTTLLQLVEEGLQQLLAGASLQQYTQQYMKQHGGASLPQLAAAVEMVAAADPAAGKAAVARLLAEGLGLGRPSHEEAVAVHRMLQVGPHVRSRRHVMSRHAARLPCTTATVSSLMSWRCADISHHTATQLPPPCPRPPYTHTLSSQVQLKDTAAAEQWKGAASKRFVFSAYFDGPSKLGLKVAADSNGSA